MPEFTKLSRKLPEEVAIAEQLLKVFINSFCNAIMLLSKTAAKTEDFGQNLNTVEEKQNKYIYRYAVYLNADPDLIEITSDRRIGPKNSTDGPIPPPPSPSSNV